MKNTIQNPSAPEGRINTTDTLRRSCRPSRILICFLIAVWGISLIAAQPETRFRLGRMNFDGGGDWYNDPDMLPNLAGYANQILKTTFMSEQVVVKPADPKIFDTPFLLITGHGNIRLSDKDIANLREYCQRGGFLYADDDYGMDDSFRREMKRLFPERDIVELPAGHSLFNCYFSFPRGVPKIHKHDEKRPQAFAIFDDYGRMMVLYTYESNISDGWAAPQVHGDPPEVRENALKFGVNILYYIMTM